MTQTADELVARGAELLDQCRPGWEKQVNLGSLSLATTDRCILGQLYGGYWNGLAVLAKTDCPKGECAYRFGADHGFSAADTTYGELDRAWSDLIRERVPA